jgi:hypothetical protein
MIGPRCPLHSLGNVLIPGANCISLVTPQQKNYNEANMYIAWRVFKEKFSTFFEKEKLYLTTTPKFTL